MKAYPSLRRWLALGATAAILAIVIAFSATAHRTSVAEDNAPAGNWPTFGGSAQRNMVDPIDKNIPTDWDVAAKKGVRWIADLGSKAYGGPIIYGGKILVGTNNEKPRDPRIVGDKGVLMCFNEADGKFLWQAAHDKLPAGRVNDWPREGICSSPFVEGNRLWYVDNRCELICADINGDPATQKSKPIWTLDMIGQENVFPHNLATSSPLVIGDIVFLVTSNGVDEGHINIPHPQAPSFLAVNKNTGKVLWRNNDPSAALAAKGELAPVAIKELVDKGLLLMHGQWSSPAYAEVQGKPQIVFPGGDGWIRSFEPTTGRLIWKCDCNPKDAFYALGGKGTRSDFVSTPIIYKNRVYIGIGQDPEHKEGIGHLWCIDMSKTGDVSLQAPSGAPNPNSAIVWHFGGPAKPGAGRKYEYGRTLSTCAIHDDLLYTADLSGWVYCLDANTGQKYWDHNMNAATWASPYWVDNKIYMGNDEEKVIIFKHGKKKEIINEIDVGEKVRATPVVANGVLYVMTETKLFAIK